MADFGRPSEYKDETADAICELLSRGWSLRRVIEQGVNEKEYKNISFPSIATVFKWMRDYPDFLKQYARAKQESADGMAEELLDIADDGRNDSYIDDNGIERTNHDVIARSRLRVDTRKFLMAKMKPKVYGDKLDLTSDGDKLIVAPLVISTIKARNNGNGTNTAADSTTQT